MNESEVDEILNGPISRLESEEAVLLRAVLGQLRDINARQIRAEAAVTAFMKSRNAKILLGFISARGGGRW